MDYIKISSDNVALLVPEALKTTKPVDHLQPIQLKTFKEIELYTVAHFKQFIKMTVPIINTGTNQLFVSLVKPHKAISTKTLSS